MARPKRRVAVHVQGEFGVTITKSSLPQHWVCREISPDYGLDLHIEMFGDAPEASGSWDALGEHIFAQVKTEKKVKTSWIDPFRSVGSKPHSILQSGDDESEKFEKLEVVSYSLEVEEIETVRRMGAAVPVVLVVVDMATRVPYFICLNDWISKVLPIFRPRWRNGKAVTVHIPTSSVLSNESSWIYLSVLAKRAKFYSAFSAFRSQCKEIKYATEAIIHAFDRDGKALREVFELKELFSFYYSDNIALDVWGSEAIPTIGLMDIVREQIDEMKIIIESVSGDPDSISNEREWFDMVGKLHRVNALYESVASSSDTYEAMVREKMLPTQLATLLPN
ncbi:DUF4365 domain-containing protein [Rhodococcus aetherivorans]